MAHVIVSRATYLRIFAALICLTGLTAWVAYHDFGFANPVVALSIAVLKGSLVVLFFMHLRWSSRLTWVVGGAGLFWLGILLVLTLSDYLTRGWGWL